jgi:hypothetical protein
MNRTKELTSMVVLPMLPPAGQIVGELASEIVAVDADVALDEEVVEFDQAVMA